jgi:hypothetical protein
VRSQEADKKILEQEIAESETNNKQIRVDRNGVQPTIKKYDELCEDTQHFLGVVSEAVEGMPRIQKVFSGGLGVLMMQHIHTALMLSERIRDYAGIGEREKLLREYTISMRLLRNIAITAHERKNFQKETTANSIARVAVHLAATATNYALWLQKHPGKGAR